MVAVAIPGWDALQITTLDICAYVGLAALGGATCNLFLGLLLAFRYNPVRQWPHRPINYARIHTFSGYAVLALAVLHPLILLFDRTNKFRLLDLVYPVNSPKQALLNCVGAAGLYLLFIVVLTSYFRLQLGRRLWKSFHFLIYVAAAAMFSHSLFTDPSLSNASPDWLDGGKLFIEGCTLLIVTTSVLRYLRARRNREA
jgi:methionine sulfoxide reductase heme-binding subunit